MSPNLAFIKDDGSTLEINIFFELCIKELENLQCNTQRVMQWFRQAQLNIDQFREYNEKMQALSLFFDTYRLFFEIPGTMVLSGSIQALIAKVLSKNPTL